MICPIFHLGGLGLLFCVSPFIRVSIVMLFVADGQTERLRVFTDLYSRVAILLDLGQTTRSHAEHRGGHQQSRQPPFSHHVYPPVAIGESRRALFRAGFLLKFSLHLSQMGI